MPRDTWYLGPRFRFQPKQVAIESRHVGQRRIVAVNRHVMKSCDLHSSPPNAPYQLSPSRAYETYCKCTSDPVRSMRVNDRDSSKKYPPPLRIRETTEREGLGG